MAFTKMRLLGTAIAVAFSTWMILSLIRAHILPQRFERVAVGDSRERVVQLMGRPRSVEKCGEPFGNPGGKPGCMEDYLYASPWAPLFPEYWSVSFDQNGHVVETYHYVSP
jgi:hypothetical protein